MAFGAHIAKCAAAAACCLIPALRPAQASSTCLTQVEARQTFPTKHLYWHGKDHCWDASAARTKKTSIARPDWRRERRAWSEVTANPSNDTITVGVASSTADAADLQPAVPAGLRHWSDTMAVPETIETTPWINRWPDQPIKPPSRPAVADAVANAALAIPRGMVAGIMALVLSLALSELLFGGTKLRTRRRFGRNDQDTRSKWAAARRVRPKTSSRSPQVEAITRKLSLARLLPTFATDRGWKRRRSDIIVK
jgi:hypothetical protein